MTIISKQTQVLAILRDWEMVHRVFVSRIIFDRCLLEHRTMFKNPSSPGTLGVKRRRVNALAGRATPTCVDRLSSELSKDQTCGLKMSESILKGLLSFRSMLVCFLYLSAASGQTPAPSSSGPVTETPAELTVAPVTPAPTLITTAPSTAPTPPPTSEPSAAPTSSMSPTISPGPTQSPTITAQPSNTPTISKSPTRSPTVAPTVSPAPTFTPSVNPSSGPTETPTENPTSSPTFTEMFTSRQGFRQQFEIPNNGTFFDPDEKDDIEVLFEGYTEDFENVTTRVESDCEITNDLIRTFENRTFVEMDYTMTYTSRVTDVTGFANGFFDYMNGNLGKVTRDMQNIGLNVINVQPPGEITRSTDSPTTSMAPSFAPTAAPTISPAPTESPSFFPSDIPSMTPTITPKPTLRPTLEPPPTRAPSDTPLNPGSSGLEVGAIAAIVVIFGLLVLIGLYCYYRSFIANQAAAASSSHHRAKDPSRSRSRRHHEYNGTDGLVIPPNDSMASSRSMISVGGGMANDFHDESDPENDNTKDLQDEFDEYRNQTLDNLRHDVEEKVVGLDGVMSAAVTKALMNDDETNVDDRALRWGCTMERPKGTEIEASVLCEVNDWLKRNEGIKEERKRLFMQDILNKMVASVRFGVMNSEDASRTIHESAALLGLELINELPMTTVLVSGMRKTATANQMIKVMKEFGNIDDAAVASGRRGFGIVRYNHRKSVDQIMRMYKSGEIVVQDVAVQLKVLTPGGVVES